MQNGRYTATSATLETFGHPRRLTVDLRRQLRFLRGDDSPSASGVDVNAKDTQLANERFTLAGAALGEETGDGGNVAVDLNLTVRAADEIVSDGRSLDITNLFGFAQDLAVPGNAGKIVGVD